MIEKKQILFTPIGIIHTPFKKIGDMPIQPVAAEGVEGSVELLPEYAGGVTDLEGFSHITLLYHLHEIKSFDLMVKPFMDDTEHGIFATRSPKRPNPIGLSTVKLLKVENNILTIGMVDMLDGSPLLDIKPFFEKFDNRFNTRAGWLDNKQNLKIKNLRSDERFKN